jgi:hypothetical protein
LLIDKELHMTYRKGIAAEPREGETRDCILPWNFSQIFVDKRVSPCCWHPSIGALDEKHSLGAVRDNLYIRTLRYQLLTGQLNHFCRECPMKKRIPIAILREKVGGLGPAAFQPKSSRDLLRPARIAFAFLRSFLRRLMQKAGR